MNKTISIKTISLATNPSYDGGTLFFTWDQVSHYIVVEGDRDTSIDYREPIVSIIFKSGHHHRVFLKDFKAARGEIA